MTAVVFDLSNDVVEGIRKAAGYHNYFNVGVFDAVAQVQRSLESAGLQGGWTAAHLNGPHDPMPDHAIRVGQVRVRHGDPGYPLIIRRLGGE